MISLRLPITVLAVGLVVSLPAIAGAQVTTGFQLMNNGALVSSTASWTLVGDIEDDKPYCPPNCQYFQQRKDPICCKGCNSCGAGAQVNTGSSIGGDNMGKGFTLSWTGIGQVSPALQPACPNTRQPCLNVEAKHQLGTNSTICEEYEGCVMLSCGDVCTQATTNNDNGGASIEWAMVTLDPCITPVGTVKTISWSFTLGGGASGEAGVECEWNADVGSTGVMNISMDDSGLSGSYVNSSGQTISADQTADFSNGINVSIYGAASATVSSESNPSAAVTVDFDSKVHLDIEEFNQTHQAHLTWDFSASIENP